MVMRELEAEEHGSEDRGATCVMETVLQSLQTEHTTVQTSPRTFRLPATPPVHVPARRLTS